MLQITLEEKKALKGRGIICNRDGETFTARIITEDGTLTARQMEALAEASRRFGSGSAALTVRMTMEIQGISYEQIEPMCQFLEQHSLYPGGTGPRVRPIVPCKGTVCVHGLLDTQALARELHRKFYLGWRHVTLPHKFKIGIGGCPNNCIKPGLNDFGIMGQRIPAYDPEVCKACGKCAAAAACPMKLCTKGQDGKMVCNSDLCTSCGKCIDACPFGAVTEEVRGCKILLGGIWGKRQRLATPLPGVYSHDEVLELLEQTLTLWKDQGTAGERFGLFLDRIGAENFIEELLEQKN